MRKRLVIAAAVALACACASTPPDAQPKGTAAATSTAPPTKYIATEGTYPVGAIPSASVHDAQRNRDLVINIEYPTRGGPYPVIIFSPGFGGTKESYTPLSAYWAGRGYIVIKPSHADAGALRAAMPTERRDDTRSTTTVQPNRRGPAAAPTKGQTTVPLPPAGELAWASQTPSDWQNRVRDVTLIIDSFRTLQQQYPELDGKIDTAHVGVAGESYGAFTALLASGATSYKTTPPLQLGDNRIRAAIAMSPQGIGSDLGLTEQSYAGLRIPVMFMTGTLDSAPGGDHDPKWRRDPFAFSPAGDKYFLSFEGARHSTFGGPMGLTEAEMARPDTVYVPMTDQYGRTVMVEQERRRDPRGMGALERERRIFSIVRLASSAFWDAYLKDDKDARDFLTATNGLQSRLESRGTIERK